MKRIIKFLSMAVVLLLTAVQVMAYDVEVNGIYYNLSGTTAEVTFNSDAKYSGPIYIPSSISANGQNYTVTSIGDSAFYRGTNLSIEIEGDGITRIGPSAFESSKTSGFTLPANLARIGRNAFYMCSTSGTFSFRGGCKKWCAIEFENEYSNPAQAYSVDYVRMSGITRRDDFYYDFSNTVLEIPDGVERINAYAFYGFDGLYNVVIPLSIKSIGVDAFRGCNSIDVYYNSLFDGYNGTVNYSSTNMQNWCNIKFESRYSNPLSQSNGFYKLVYVSSSFSPGYKPEKVDIVIPNGVTEIKDYAFAGYSGSITIPQTVTKIGKYAFYEAGSITNLTIPRSVKTIDEYAFSESTIKEVTFSEGLTTIGNSAFLGCDSLKTVSLPTSVNSVGANAFNICESLTSVSVPEGLTEIGRNAFSISSPWYESLPEGMVYLGKVAYDHKGSGSPSTVINIREGIEVLNPNVFYSDTVKSITIPSSVKRIGENAFGFYDRTIKMDNVCISDLDAWCNIKFENYQANPLFRSSHLLLNGKEVKEVTFPEGTTHIGDYVFYSCDSLTNVTIPESVTSIGTQAFSGTRWYNRLGSDIDEGVVYLGNIAYKYKRGYSSEGVNIKLREGTTCIASHLFSKSNLTSIEIPNSVKHIGDRAFYECKQLKEVNLPDSLEYLGNDVFEECPLTSLTIPGSVVYIGDMSGDSYDSFRPKTLIFEDGEKELVVDGDILSKYSSTVEEIYCGRNGLMEKLLAVEITSYSMYNPAKNLKVFSTGKNVSTTDITSATFAYNSQLTQLTLGSGETHIGKQAFRYNPLLKTVNVNSKTVSIDEEAFTGSFVEEVSVSADGTGGCIADSAFNGCSELESVFIKGNFTIGADVFAGCAALKALEIPSCGTYDGANVGLFGSLFGTNAYSGMKAVENMNGETHYFPAQLSEVTITEGCTQIPEAAFYNCSMIEKLTLPTTIKGVKENAFYGCDGLTDLYVHRALPPSAYESSFTGVNQFGCKLHVPLNSKQYYSIATGWKYFFFIEEEAGLTINVTKNIENAGEIVGIMQYQRGETAEIEAIAHSGYTFIGWSENGKILSKDAKLTLTMTEDRNITALFSEIHNNNDVTFGFQSGKYLISWSAEADAMFYNITVYTLDNGVKKVVKTLRLDASGNLITRNSSLISVELDELTDGETYNYTIEVYKDEETVLSKYSGSFVASGSDGIVNQETAVIICKATSGGVRLYGIYGTEVNIYSVNGIPVYRGVVNDGEIITLDAGLYFVRVAGQTFKCLVR